MIAAHYHRWNLDPAIRYALMADDGKKTPPGSPKKPRGGDGAGGSGKEEVMRVIQEVGGGSANWPMLTRTNYTRWALVMKVKMQARHL